MRYALTLTAAALALASCAPTGVATPGPQAGADREPARCFQPQRVINFREGPDQNLYLRILGGDVFEARSGGCIDLGRSNGLVIEPSSGIGDRLCVGDQARITPSSSTFPTRPCLARIERSLTEAEIEALPSRSRP